MDIGHCKFIATFLTLSCQTITCLIMGLCFCERQFEISHILEEAVLLLFRVPNYFNPRAVEIACKIMDQLLWWLKQIVRYLDSTEFSHPCRVRIASMQTNFLVILHILAV
jgi:hypothetical protein